MSLMSRVQRGRTSKPPRILLYGVEGIGKSTFGSQAPKPLFIQTEDGLDEIDCDKFPLATSYDDLQLALTELHAQQHDYETVVIDSLDWLERLVWDAVCKEYGVKSIEKADGGYAKGYTHALTYWRQVVDLLNALRNGKGMVVLLIAHAKVEKFEDPESSAYDRYSPRLHKHAAALICEWSDAVLCATRKFRTQTEETGFNRKRTIANAVGKDGGERILRCVGGSSCIAKNRFGIAEELPLSWAAFVAALSNKQTTGEANGWSTRFRRLPGGTHHRFRPHPRRQISGGDHRVGDEGEQGQHGPLPAARLPDHRGRVQEPLPVGPLELGQPERDCRADCQSGAFRCLLGRSECWRPTTARSCTTCRW